MIAHKLGFALILLSVSCATHRHPSSENAKRKLTCLPAANNLLDTSNESTVAAIQDTLSKVQADYAVAPFLATADNPFDKLNLKVGEWILQGRTFEEIEAGLGVGQARVSRALAILKDRYPLFARDDVVFKLAYLKKGADINEQYSDTRETVLMAAIGSKMSRLVEAVLKRGVALTPRESDEVTPLIRAAQVGDQSIAEMLLKKGAKLSEKDELGMTPFLWAVKSGHLDLAKLFLAKGSKLNEVSSTRESALILASIEDHYDLVTFLLNQGADVFAVDKEGNGFAEYNGQPRWTVGRARTQKTVELEQVKRRSKKIVQ
jgi:ankyrin repeat protein